MYAPALMRDGAAGAREHTFIVLWEACMTSQKKNVYERLHET